MNMAPAYRAGVEAANGLCPIEVGILGHLADNECAHGWLGHETRGQACGCYAPDGRRLLPSERTPDLIPILSTPKGTKKMKTKSAPKEPVPVLRSVVLDLEREIERLSAAKAALEKIAA